jgi:hypothetical protein
VRTPRCKLWVTNNRGKFIEDMIPPIFRRPFTKQDPWLKNLFLAVLSCLRVAHGTW